ncbi:MAG TPA: YhjD/YihY/BrkB family envelope integrity protein, partial [Candidatus Saccharimonadales bacterium]
LGLILIGGLILVATSLTAGWLARDNTIEYHLLATIINFGLFLLGYRVATSRRIKTKSLIIQASLTTVAWQALQIVGGLLVQHQLNRLDVLYGSFAIVLGLLFWLYLIARVAVYSIELDVVLSRQFWPRGVTEKLTAADKRFYTANAKMRKRHQIEKVEVTFSHRR